MLSALVIGFRYALTPILGDTGPFYLASLAVLVSAYFGGFWPGILATALTTVGGFLLYMPMSIQKAITDPQRALILSAQIVICTSISLICQALKDREAECESRIVLEQTARGKLDTLLSGITDKLITLSTELRLVSFNNAAAERWNMNLEMIGLSFMEVLPPATAEALQGPLKRTLVLGEAMSLEVYDHSLDRTYEIRIFPSPEGLLVYFRNVSDRIQANRAITALAEEQQKTNALLDSLLSHAPVGFAFFDQDLVCQQINGSLADLNGESDSSLVGKRAAEIVPFNSPNICGSIEQVFRGRTAIEQMEISAGSTGESGSERHWHMGLYPVFDSCGEVAAAGAILIEITQRRQMENRLSESEARFRNVADNSPVFIWVLNSEGTATWFNQPWLDFRQVTLEKAIEEGCLSNVHADDNTWVQEAYADAISHGRPFALEFRTLATDGLYRWIHFKASPMLDETGRVSSYLMSGIDVSDRIAMEDHLRKSLANERMARSDAEKANRLKDEFLASLSHELRTPLTTMLGWTELLMKPKVQENELKNGLEVIQRSSRLQLQLINDLLDMSRMNIGKVTLESEYAELYDTVKSTVDLVQGAADEKGLRINFDEPKAPIIVKIDADRFAQVIWNVLTNAIKFTPQNGCIQIEVGRTELETYVKVADTGIGIEESFLPYVFERFRQADAGRTRRHGGLGLGLAIARQLIELHGGSITVESQGVNQGATFTVHMPTVEDTEVALKNREAVALSQGTEELRLAGLCILLVEDDAASRDILKRILESEGSIVIPAESAVVARRLIRETRPDLIISDIGLPDEDGNQLMRTLRSSRTDHPIEVPSIALTAFAGSEDRMQAFESGFNAHLVKPVETEELVHTIQELIASPHD